MKVLIAAPGKIGDTILTTPLYKVLKQEIGVKKLGVIASRKSAFILNNNPYIDELFIYEKSPLKAISFIKKIRKEKYDFYIDPKDHLSDEFQVVARFPRAKTKIGFNDEKHSYFDLSINPMELMNKLHHIQIFLHPLKYLNYNLPTAIPRPELYPNEDSTEYINKVLADVSDYIVLNISASHPRKMPENGVLEKFLKEINLPHPTYLLYAPSEKDRAKDLLSRTNKLIDFKSRNFDDAAILIKKAKLLISPDTSLIHVASTYNTPLLTFFSGMDNFFNKFKPLSDIQEIVRAEQGDNSVHSITSEQMIIAYSNIVKRL